MSLADRGWTHAPPARPASRTAETGDVPRSARRTARPTSACRWPFPLAGERDAAGWRPSQVCRITRGRREEFDTPCCKPPDGRVPSLDVRAPSPRSAGAARRRAGACGLRRRRPLDGLDRGGRRRDRGRARDADRDRPDDDAPRGGPHLDDRQRRDGHRRPGEPASRCKVTSGPDVIVGAFDKSDLTTEVITDHAVVYTHSAQLSQLLGAGRKWVKFDVEKVGQAGRHRRLRADAVRPGPDPGRAPAQGRQRRHREGRPRGGPRRRHDALPRDRRPAPLPGARPRRRARRRARRDRPAHQGDGRRAPCRSTCGSARTTSCAASRRSCRSRAPAGRARSSSASSSTTSAPTSTCGSRPSEVVDVSELAASGAATIGP